MDFSDPVILERRRPVWNALADLCLDTEITDNHFHYIAGVVRRHGFSADEARAIAYDEVFPIVYLNVYGGQWAGFDRDGLEQAILSRIASFGGKPVRCNLFRRFFGYPMVDEALSRVLKALDE